MKPLFFGIVLLIATSVIYLSCVKSDEPTTVYIHLTDKPFNAEEVNVDIEEIRVKFRDDSASGWSTLQTNVGIYNLLALQNGVDTLIASGTIPTNVVKEIRFILGSDNSIKVDGQVYPLTIPSGSESGLKLKIDKRLNSGVDSLTIDFDAALSIHQTGAGAYHLKPVLKLK